MNPGNSLTRRIRPRALLFLILLALPFNLLLFPRRSSYLVELTGDQHPIIDTWFAYTPEKIYEILPAYGESGRQLYAVSELTLDLAYPLIYNSFLWLAITLVFQKAFPSQSRSHKLAYLPVAVCLCDYTENALIAALLLGYPRQLNLFAWAASFFTTGKWLMGILAVLSILAGLGIWFFRSRRGVA
jgi:hypothetical protein